MKKVFSILIFAFLCVPVFAQQNFFKDTTEANEKGFYQSIKLLRKKNATRYKTDKIDTINAGDIKIGGKETTDKWFTLVSTKSEYGKAINNGFSEQSIKGFEYDTIKLIGPLNEVYVLYKKKQSEWNTWFGKKGWKATETEGDKNCIKIHVKKSDGKDNLLYGKLDEIKETKELVRSGYSRTKPNGNFSDTTIVVNGTSLKLYKKEADVASTNREKKVTQGETTKVTGKQENEQKNDISKQVKTGIIIIIVVVIALFILAIVVLLFFMKKMKALVPQPKQPVDNPQPKQPIDNPQPKQPVDNPAPSPENIAFAKYTDEWIVVGASITGNGHIAQKMPCQDSHKYEYLGDGWGIAVISDGAGSAIKSHVGSKIVIQRTIEHFKNLIIGRNWIKKNELPTETEWSQIAFATLKAVRNDMEHFAKAKNIELKSLYATVIVIIHTPKGLLVTHIGDGRAGYKNENGEWKALIIPHKGEEANQTIFVPSDFWDIPAYKMSGALVPESVVINEKAFAFTLMSDGCENVSWLYNQKDEKTGRFFDPNKPYPNFFNPLDKTLQTSRKDGMDEQEIADKWRKFLESGNPAFIKETDDKTMILGVIYK